MRSGSRLSPPPGFVSVFCLFCFFFLSCGPQRAFATLNQPSAGSARESPQAAGPRVPVLGWVRGAPRPLAEEGEGAGRARWCLSTHRPQHQPDVCPGREATRSGARQGGAPPRRCARSPGSDHMILGEQTLAFHPRISTTSISPFSPPHLDLP